MAFHFSILPRDVDTLTIGEFEHFSSVIDEMDKRARADIKQQEREAKGLTRKR